MNKRKVAKLILVTILLLFGIVFFAQRRVVKIAITSSGVSPSYVTILKGQKIEFSSSVGKYFWIASDPHPSHVFLPTFDSKEPIPVDKKWVHGFNEPGVFQYHDHMQPSFRGTIKVVETNPVAFIYNRLLGYYKLYFEKHDDAYIQSKINLCTNNNGRVSYMECWSNLLSEITNTFGITEAMNVLSQVRVKSQMTIGDCHLLADQIGTDAYWLYSSGKKFEFNSDFSLCDYGFFHHFMSEYVSHGQDISASESFCKSLPSDLVMQCYLGLGNGLSYYYWNIYPLDAEAIVSKSLEMCDKISTNKDQCVYGVYSGIDHIFEGQHGSELTIDLKNPFVFCAKQTNRLYQISCYERMVPSILYVLGTDPSKSASQVVSWILRMPFYAQPEASRRLGIMLAEEEAVKINPDIVTSLNICRKFKGNVRGECLWGVFYNVFENSKLPTGKFFGFSCDSVMPLSNSELSICEESMFSAIGKEWK